MLLDISAAFDTADHEVLLRRLPPQTVAERSHTVSPEMLSSGFGLIYSIVSNFARFGLTESSIIRLLCGIPQASVFVLFSFVLYIADLVHLIEQYDLRAHQHADDTGVFGSCLPHDVITLQSRLTACVDDVASWMRFYRLQLNTNKTEILWCATARRQGQLTCTPLRVVTN